MALQYAECKDSYKYCTYTEIQNDLHLVRISIIYTYTDKIENAMTGFRPIRSAIIPQKTEAKPLPTMYDAATFENVDISH